MFEGWLNDWLLRHGVSPQSAGLFTLLIEIGLAALIATAVHFFVRAIMVRLVQTVVARVRSDWLEPFARRRPISRLAHLAPALVVYRLAGLILVDHPTALAGVRQLCLIYMALATAWMISGVIGLAEDIARNAEAARRLPVRSFSQVAQIILFIVTAILVTSLILDRSPIPLLGGLGAASAVLLLVFKDAILGFVAGIQLSANHMVEIGDWIEMPKYGADGFVIDVALTTVKVQNWDKTITTIPTYALISDSFKNWRGMFESGGRRIKRAIYIDMTSIRFCTDDMLDRYSRIQHVGEYLRR